MFSAGFGTLAIGLGAGYVWGALSTSKRMLDRLNKVDLMLQNAIVNIVNNGVKGDLSDEELKDLIRSEISFMKIATGTD